MGRWDGYGRRTVEQTRSISIGTLRRAGFVGQPARNWWKWRWKANDVGIWPKHWRGGLIHLTDQILQTEQMSWRFGGHRFYFLCECGRRVEKLHAFGDRPWRCRHCYNLTYATRQAVPPSHLHGAKDPRAARRGSPSMLDVFPPKPKGMHQRRYERLRRRHDTQRAFGMTAAYLAKLRPARSPKVR